MEYFWIFAVTIVGAYFIYMKRARLWHHTGEGDARQRVYDREREWLNGFTFLGIAFLIGVAYYLTNMFHGIPDELAPGRSDFLQRGSQTWTADLEAGKAGDVGKIVFSDDSLKVFEEAAAARIRSSHSHTQDHVFHPETVEYIVRQHDWPQQGLTRCFSVETIVTGKAEWKEKVTTPATPAVPAAGTTQAVAAVPKSTKIEDKEEEGVQLVFVDFFSRNELTEKLTSAKLVKPNVGKIVPKAIPNRIGFHGSKN